MGWESGNWEKVICGSVGGRGAAPRVLRRGAPVRAARELLGLLAWRGLSSKMGQSCC